MSQSICEPNYQNINQQAINQSMHEFIKQPTYFINFINIIKLLSALFKLFAASKFVVILSEKLNLKLTTTVQDSMLQSYCSPYEGNFTVINVTDILFVKVWLTFNCVL